MSIGKYLTRLFSAAGGRLHSTLRLATENTPAVLIQQPSLRVLS